VRNALSQSPVVRQQQQALGVVVQSPNRENPWAVRHQVHDRRSTLRVIRGCDHTRRLVQQVVDETRPNTNFEPIDLDDVIVDLDTPTEYRNDAIDSDATLSDHLLTRTAGTETMRRQHFL
jgi:hypothetical protein